MSWWRRLTIAATAALLAGGAAPGPGLAQQAIQLRFMSWYFGEDPAGPALKALFAEVEKRNPTIKVVAEKVTSAQRGPQFTPPTEAGRGAGLHLGTPPD